MCRKRGALVIGGAPDAPIPVVMRESWERPVLSPFRRADFGIFGFNRLIVKRLPSLKLILSQKSSDFWKFNFWRRAIDENGAIFAPSMSPLLSSTADELARCSWRLVKRRALGRVDSAENWRLAQGDCLASVRFATSLSVF